MKKQFISLILLSFCFLFGTTTMSAQKLETSKNALTVITDDVKPSVYISETKGGLKITVNNAKVAIVRIYNPDGSIKIVRVVRGSNTIFINTSSWKFGGYVVEVVMDNEYVHEQVVHTGVKYQMADPK